jgi:hypothetical protein
MAAMAHRSTWRGCVTRRTFITDVPVEWIPAGEPFTKL